MVIGGMCRGAGAPDWLGDDAPGRDAGVQHVPAAAAEPAPGVRHRRGRARDDLHRPLFRRDVPPDTRSVAASHPPPPPPPPDCGQWRRVEIDCAEMTTAVHRKWWDGL